MALIDKEPLFSGILISLDDSEDSFDSAAEDDDEKYLNGIFCTHSLSSHNPNFHRNECSQAQIKQCKYLYHRF